MFPELGEDAGGVRRRQKGEGCTFGPGAELPDRKLRGLGLDTDGEGRE